MKRSIQRENYILYAGILSDRKGYNRLIEAFSKIAAKYPDWKIKFAGNGEIEKGKSLAVKFGIEQQTEFLGWIAGNTKESIFQHASILLFAPVWGRKDFPIGSNRCNCLWNSCHYNSCRRIRKSFSTTVLML